MSAPLALPLPGGPPLAALAAALPDARRPLLFDAGTAPSSWTRWNFLVFDPEEVVELRAGDLPEPDAARRALGRVDALLRRHFPEEAAQSASAADAASAAHTEDVARPPFAGGVVALLAFDLGRELERLPARVPRDLAVLPDLVACVHRFALAEERATGRRFAVGRGSPQELAAFAREVESLGRAAAPLAPSVVGRASCGAVTSSFDRDGYVQAVAAAQQAILDGHIYQVNLSQRFRVEGGPSPDALCAALRAGSPAAFAALLRTPDFAFVSNSPELFLRRRGAELLSRPIKGTRPRGATPAEDARLCAELQASPKESAELAMIVDLVRNDLGRSARIGSVTVQQPFETEVLPAVFHRVASVRARLAADVSSTACVEAAFPPASVTGTPKISALSVIEALEPVRRHFYTGALGWFDAGGDFDLSVAIRVATRAEDAWLVPVGGGVTLLSHPEDEYEETLHKARGLFAALGLPEPARLAAAQNGGAR